jgi:hypothetical protein
VDGEGTTGPCEAPGCGCKLYQGGEKRCTCGHNKDDHRHVYVLLTVGDQHVEDPDGLSTQAMFTFLYQQYLAHPHAAFVGFFVAYDVNQWLKGLPEVKAWLLLTAMGQRKRRYGKDRRHIAPVRLNEDRPGAPDAWEVDVLADKRLSIRPLVCACGMLPTAERPHPKAKCPQKRVPYIDICDAGPFFQTSLMKAIDPAEWGEHPVCSVEEFATLDRGKKRRADASLDDAMREYNALENEVLARLMGRIDQGFRSIGVHLRRSQWYGPGAAVAEWFKTIDAPRREGLLEKVVPYQVNKAAMAAYVAGWFEIFMHGHVPGTTWEYDIASAYPYIMASLPCLVHGHWERHSGGAPPLQAGQLRLVHCPPGGVRGSDPFIGAMMHRTKRGRILRPQVTGGWYWSHELEAAKRAGLVDEAEVDESWTYTSCDCPPPFAKEADLYMHRLEVGKKSPEGKASKLVMNSGYGKLAQSVGDRPFACMVYASLITAGTRSMILDAIATHPERSRAVVMVATDAVFFTSPHPTLPRETVRLSMDGAEAPVLGSWDEERHEALCVLKPGVYWHDKSRERIREGKDPSFKARGINAKAFAKHLEDLDGQAAELASDIEYQQNTDALGLFAEATEPDEALYLDELERLGAGPGQMMAPPPLTRHPDGSWRRGSQSYDWFDSLAKAEQARLRGRWFSSGPHAMAPDEVSELVPLDRWLDLTRRADLARVLSSGRQPRDLARFGGLSPSVVSAVHSEPRWPSVVYEVGFAMVSCKQALQRHRWEMAGKVSTARVVQSANPAAKRAEAYYDEERGVVRTAPYDKADELESTPYTPQFVKEALADALGMPFGDEREDYMTPDGPAGAIFYGQLGTGQWA